MLDVQKIIATEEDRTNYLNKTVVAADLNREAVIKKHDAEARDLLAERIQSVSWQEKDELTARLLDHQDHDPRKYKTEYKSHDCPYFGVVSIDDDKIGARTYVIGKETLMDGNVVAVVDWRKAPVSRFFYEYKEGENYEEEVQGQERTGTITERRIVLVQEKELVAISQSGVDILKKDGAWQTGAEEKEENGKVDTQTSRANDPASHVLPEIISLISADQFRIIAGQITGCVSLTGGAGTGKTSVAIHRLSYLQYNHPDLFQPEKCLVMMFNRPLRDYVSLTSERMLGDTAVDTFASWALRALRGYGITIPVKSIKNIVGRECGGATKSIKTCEAIGQYIGTKKGPVTLSDLFGLYSSDVFDESICGLKKTTHTEFARSLEDKSVAWSDLPVLLKLCQAVGGGSPVEDASDWYHHIVIDEAQDFGYLELDCLFTAANKAKSLTICSDSQQHILPLVDAQGLSIFQEKIYLRGLDKENLRVSYRCPPDIMALALSVRAGSRVERGEYPSVQWRHSESVNRAEADLVDLVGELAKSQTDLTAVICKKKTDVAKIREMLKHVPGVHSDGAMSFGPGVLITNVHQVKGLEFDHVVLWNPSKSDWGSSQTDVNLLYVAITRSAKSLSFVHHKPLPEGIRNPNPDHQEAL